MSHGFKIVVERDAEGWYVGSVPALRGCHAQGRTSEEPMERLREAIALCLEMEEDVPHESSPPDPRPDPISRAHR